MGQQETDPDSGSIMQQPGHTQGTWPAAGQGIGTEELHWYRLSPSLWGKQVDDNYTDETIHDAEGNAEGWPCLATSPPRVELPSPFLWPICLV